MNEISKGIIRSLKLLEKNSDLSLNELRVIVALERVASRVSQNKVLSNHLIFKGGFVLYKMYDSNRFTRDIDALGNQIDIATIKSLLPIVLCEDQNDGLWFGDIKIIQLKDQGFYGGLRFNLAFQIGDEPLKEKISNLSRIHFDVGVGDYVPSDIDQSKTALISEKERFLSWKVYPPEFIFSEKLQTFVDRGDANSRAKDIYDLVWLSEKCNDKNKLAKAIKDTFNQRETKIPKSWIDFFEVLSFDLLKKSWKSVKVSKDELDFDEAIARFKDVIKKLP